MNLIKYVVKSPKILSLLSALWRLSSRRVQVQTWHAEFVWRPLQKHGGSCNSSTGTSAGSGGLNEVIRGVE